MFREMARKKQALTKEQCVAILTAQPRGVLSVCGENGYPYGMPMNHWYDEKTGNLYFHGGKSGHKIDALKRCDKVSYCVFDQGVHREKHWALHIQSVVVFGRIRFVEDPEEVAKIARCLSHKFTNDETYIEGEIASARQATLCLEMTVEHMTGKIVSES